MTPEVSSGNEWKQGKFTADYVKYEWQTGCLYGLDGSKSRSDARSMIIAWFVTTWAIGVAVTLVLAYFVRTAAERLWRNVVDQLQSMAIDRFQRQFYGCRFSEIPLTSLVSGVPYELLQNSLKIMQLKGVPRIWYVAHHLHGTPRPSAYTTFHMVNQRSIIICAFNPEKLNSYNRFVLYHEIGHACGLQSSHLITPVFAFVDLAVISTLYCAAGTDHVWAWPVFAAYCILRVAECFSPRKEEKVEFDADVFATWALMAQGRTEAEIAEVHRLHSVMLGQRSEAAAERLKYIADVIQTEVARRRSSFEAVNETVKSGGEIRIIYRMNRSRTAPLANMEYLASRPEWLPLKTAIMFLCGVGFPAFLGWGLRPVQFGVTLALLTAGTIAIVVLSHMFRTTEAGIIPTFQRRRL